MTVRAFDWMAVLAAGTAYATLAACSPSAPAETAPPPPPQQSAPPPLAGGPPVTQHAPAPTVVTMAPIANPEDLSPAERRRIYGRHGVAHHAWRIGHGPVAAPAPAPVHVAAAPPVAKPVPAAPPTKLVQLQAAVGQAVVQGSNLAVSPDIAQGKPGGVALTLPANLWDVLRAQAEKFGFKRAARHADVSATLSGDGYAVTPNGSQSQALKAGQAARFAWQVTPGQKASGPLRAEVSAELKGQGASKLLSLATLQSAVAQVTAQAQAAQNGLHLPSLSEFFAKLFGHKSDTAAAPAPAAATTPAAAPAPADASQSPLHDRTLPIIGHVTVRAQIAAFLAFLAVLILLLIQRNMAEQRRAAERRRFRTMNTAYQPMEMEPTVHHEPMMIHEPIMSHEPEVAHHEPEVAHHEPDVVHEHSVEHDHGHDHDHDHGHDHGHGHEHKPEPEPVH